MSDSKDLATNVWFNLGWCAGELGLVVWAVTTNNAGASNIVQLLAGLCVFLGVLMVPAISVAEEPDSRPRWLRRTLNFGDFILVVLLAWFGWMWCAAAFAFGGIMSAAYRERKGRKFYANQLSNPSTK